MIPSGFDLELRTRIVYGEGALDRLGELAAGITTGRALVVTDPGLVRAGHVERAEASLRAAGLATERFEGVENNPTTDHVDACLAVARELRPDLFVGLGGGSSIDVAKGANLLLCRGGTMRDHVGPGGSRDGVDPMVPLIAVPTTAGTGSEVQSFALIADPGTHRKMACGDPRGAPDVAVLDPELAVSMPHRVTAESGLDAIGHAVETAVTRKRTSASSIFSREAFRLAFPSLPRVLEAPDDLEARGRMCLAATFAGIAIENSMLGAAHSMANPLTARFGVVHGQAVAMALPFVVAYNAADPAIARIYADLARGAGLCKPGGDDGDAVRLLAAALRSLLVAAGMPTSLADCGVAREDCPVLAEEAASQWTAGFNPREVTAADFAGLFEEARGGAG